MRLFHDLLTLHGYVTEPHLLRELAGAPLAGAPGTGAPAATGTDAVPAELPGPSAAPPGQAADAGPSTHPGQRDETRPAVAGFGRGVVTLCATALSLFR